MIASISAMVSTMCSFDIRYVKVLSLESKSYQDGTYFKVGVLQETGYWFERFFINVFPSMPIHDSLIKGMKLRIEVFKSYLFALEATKLNIWNSVLNIQIGSSTLPTNIYKTLLPGSQLFNELQEFVKGTGI